MKQYGNYVRINRDSLRKMLHFGKWTGKNEGLTKDASRALATAFLSKNMNVIIDDTNLNEGTIESWKSLAEELDVGFEIVMMTTPMEECIKRDALRTDSVGRAVIVNMALLNGLYPKPNLGFVICDIDGTLADGKHRRHWVAQKPKDWKSYFAEMDKDTPIMDTIDKVMDFEGKGYEIILLSGRPEDYREVTENWLDKTFKGYMPYKTIIMRRSGDSRPDDIVKQEIYGKYFKVNNYPVHCVIDDRPSVIRMWRSNGLEVIDVGDGKEF